MALLKNPNEPLQISREDLYRLVNILAEGPFAYGYPAERRTFLERGGLVATFVENLELSGSSHTAATKLLNQLVKAGFPIVAGPPGYTALGLLLTRLVDEEWVGYRDALYIAALIMRYRLIDLEVAEVSPLLQSLLEKV